MALLLNETVLKTTPGRSRNHWVQFSLRGRDSERDAVGARVILFTETDQWTQWVTGGDGYMSKNESVLHFGLGKTDTLKNVEVVWPSGLRQSFSGLVVDRRWLLVESQTDAFSVN